jgi:hypothetical protein
MSHKHICNEDLLSRYINFRTFESVEGKALAASNQIKELCPNITHACCSYEEIMNMSNLFSIKIKKAHAIITLFERFVQRLSFLRSGDTEVLYKTSLNNSCSNYSKVEFQAALDYINKFKTNIVTNFRELINIDIEYNKGFACELCKVEANYHFAQSLDGSYIVNVNVDSCLKYIPRVADYLPNVIYSFHKIEILIKTIGCEMGLPFSLDLSINHNSQKIIFEEEMKKCKTAEYTLQSSKCVEFCSLGILNNFWGSFVVDVIQVANMILSEWEMNQKLGHFDEGIDSLDFTYDDLKFQYFIDPIKSVVGMNIEDYTINIVNSGGWNLFNDPINIVSGELISKIFIFLGVSSLLILK